MTRFRGLQAASLVLALAPGALAWGLIAHDGGPGGMSPPLLFCFALLWAAVLLQALEGLGGAVVMMALGSRNTWGLHAAVGMATLVLVGGWLNWFKYASAGILSAVVWAGVGLGLIARVWRTDGGDRQPVSLGTSRWWWPLGALLAVALAWRYVQSAAWPGFNGHDDFHGYLVFPRKMLELGWLGVDAFSERRLVSGLGGQNIFLASLGVELPERFAHLFDPGMALLISAALVLGADTRPENGPWARLAPALGLLGVSLMVPTALNTSADYSVMPMVVAMMILLARVPVLGVASEKRAFRGHALLLGLLVGASCTLKNTFLPFVGLIGIGAVILLAFELGPRLGGARGLVRFMVVAVIAVVLVMLPWMLDLRRSSGTLFYPLLGRGVHGSVYGSFPMPSAGFLSPGRIGHSLNSLVLTCLQLLFLANLTMAGLVAWNWRTTHFAARLALLVCTTAMLTMGAIWFAAGAYGTYRYSVPVLLAGFLASVVLLREEMAGNSSIRTVLCGLCLVIVGYGWSQFESDLRPGVAAVKRAVAGQDIVSAADRSAYKRLGEAIPRDGAVLTRLSLPFLLDQRADMYIADYPGGASPAPGMPSGRNAEQLADYLRAQKIRYVVWDYGREANFSRASFSDRLEPGEHPWVRAEAAATFDFQDGLEKLRQLRRVIYDSDGIAVIDLDQK